VAGQAEFRFPWRFPVYRTEVEQRGGLAHFQQHAGEAAALGRIEFDHLTHLVVGIRHRIFCQRRLRHRLDQVGIALAEGVERTELERLVRAFRQADQARFEKRRKLTLAEQQRGRSAVEGSDEISTVGGGEPIMQGQVRRFVDDGSVGHVVCGDRQACCRQTAIVSHTRLSRFDRPHLHAYSRRIFMARVPTRSPSYKARIRQ
jgi:hypothetical protein